MDEQALVQLLDDIQPIATSGKFPQNLALFGTGRHLDPAASLQDGNESGFVLCRGVHRNDAEAGVSFPQISDDRRDVGHRLSNTDILPGLQPAKSLQLRTKYENRSCDADHDHVQREDDSNPEMDLEVQPPHGELLGPLDVAPEPAQVAPDGSNRVSTSCVGQTQESWSGSASRQEEADAGVGRG